jgi:hypothetical protein
VTTADGKKRKATKPNGATYTSDNGYEYTKVEGKWRLTHHLIAEKKYGRPIKKGERVRFKDGNRTNLDPDNIEITNPLKRTIQSQLAILYAKRDEINAAIEDMEQQLREEGKSIEDALKDIEIFPEAEGAIELPSISNSRVRPSNRRLG